MDGHGLEGTFRLEVGDQSYDLNEANLFRLLYEAVPWLVFLKEVERATFVLGCREDELSGAGSERFDPICVGLYRHLKEKRYVGPSYPDLGDNARSFRLHSIVDGLAAVAFFQKGGDLVPHLIVGRPDRDVLAALDRGRRTRLIGDDPEILSRLEDIVGGIA